MRIIQFSTLTLIISLQLISCSKEDKNKTIDISDFEFYTEKSTVLDSTLGCVRILLSDGSIESQRVRIMDSTGWIIHDTMQHGPIIHLNKPFTRNARYQYLISSHKIYTALFTISTNWQIFTTPFKQTFGIITTIYLV